MNRNGVLLLLVTLLAGVPVYGAGLPATIRLAWMESSPVGAVVTLHARSATESTESADIALDGNEASILLSPGQWFVSASCPGYWSEPVLVSVAGQPVEASLTLYRATRLRAVLTIPPPGKARTVDVYFSPTESTSGQPRGSATCPVADGQVDCELPSGLYDLAFRIPGHATLYRWSVDLRAMPSADIDQNKSKDIGKLAFRVGSTLSGRVEVNGGEHQDSLESVKVTLRSATGGDRNDALRDRESLTGMVSRPNQRGFFSFDVLPGSYVVSASAAGLVSEEREVMVIEGREAVLEEPLVLERLWTLTVNVQLPPEGADQPWKVAVTRFDSEGHPSAERVLSIPHDGICRFEGQSTGSYAVELKILDSVWASQSSFLERDTAMDMSVRVTKVRGSIQLGEQPLPASLLFQSRSKGIRIPARSRADGTFLVYLPDVAGKPWEQLEIQSAQPWVKRVLEDVPLDRDDAGMATMVIRLPENRVDGVVVDESDRPVMSGLINISAPDGFRQVEMSDGTFTMQGLQPGRYSLTAATPERETEEPFFVDIPGEGERRHDVVLKVAPISQLRGSVFSASGPVIGASVFIRAPNDVHSIVGSIPVDTTGGFTFRVPPQTPDILVAVTAPGFSFRMMRMPLPEAKLDLVADQQGGVLTIDGRVGARAEPFRPYVIHNGAILTGYTVAYLARGRFLADPDQRVHFEIASAEQGAYSLCLLRGDEERSVRLGAPPPELRCVSGVLTRHGALKLHAPEVEAESNSSP